MHVKPISEFGRAPDREAIVWLAGIFEGEGSVWAYDRKNRKCVDLCLQVVSTDIDVLERCKSIAGVGSIFQGRKGDEIRKPCFKWAVHGQQAYAVIVMIYPFLLSRRAEKARESILLWLATSKRAAKYNTKQWWNEDNLRRTEKASCM